MRVMQQFTAELLMRTFYIYKIPTMEQKTASNLMNLKSQVCVKSALMNFLMYSDLTMDHRPNSQSVFYSNFYYARF